MPHDAFHTAFDVRDGGRGRGRGRKEDEDTKALPRWIPDNQVLTATRRRVSSKQFGSSSIVLVLIVVCMRQIVLWEEVSSLQLNRKKKIS